jgi:hypothetical protein
MIVVNFPRPFTNSLSAILIIIAMTRLEKWSAIPWLVSYPRVSEKQLVVSIRSHRFQMAPAFANGEDFSEGIFTSRDRAYYGKKLAPGTETAQPMGAMPSSCAH